MNKSAQNSALGKKVPYNTQYSSDLLFPIARKDKRDEIGILSIAFFGVDIWNHYEVSWLDLNGKPVVAVAEIIYDCSSPFIIESKSMKLYFNSFNNHKFKDVCAVEDTVEKDIESLVGVKVFVRILPLNLLRDTKIAVGFDGTCLDELNIECSTYTIDNNFLFTHAESVHETLFSNLLKSNCLVTNQPDWASIQIIYKGQQIDHEGLLRYIVSFRNHNDFHEHCIERIFMDILKHCQPEELTVYGRYTRRGGLDINPYRSTQKVVGNVKNSRLFRQ